MDIPGVSQVLRLHNMYSRNTLTFDGNPRYLWRARLVEKDEQIGELAKQHRWEMDRLGEERDKQIKRLSADAQQMKQEIVEGQDAMNAAIMATMDDRANSMSQMERRVTKLEDSTAAAVEVKQLKDRVEQVERSTTTKAEHEKLVQPAVTRTGFNDLLRKQEATGGGRGGSTGGGRSDPPRGAGGHDGILGTSRWGGSTGGGWGISTGGWGVSTVGGWGLPSGGGRGGSTGGGRSTSRDTGSGSGKNKGKLHGLGVKGESTRALN